MSTIYARVPAIEMAPLQDETILFNPSENQFCVLNRTASFLWGHLADPITTEALAARLCESFSSVAPEHALRDADQAIQQMLSLNFVTANPNTEKT